MVGEFVGTSIDTQRYITPSPFFNHFCFFVEADRDNNNLIDFGEFVSVISSLDIIDIRRTYEDFDSVDIQLEFDKFAIQVGERITTCFLWFERWPHARMPQRWAYRTF